MVEQVAKRDYGTGAEVGQKMLQSTQFMRKRAMSTPVIEAIDLSGYIEIRDGRANVRGRRLPVVFIAKHQQANHSSVSDLADGFTLSDEQVLAALLYYREHQAELDAQYAADAMESKAMAERYYRKPGQP
jgi:uncharacterized protein (DUF433 family)